MPRFITIINNTCAKEQEWNEIYLNTDRVETVTERNDGKVLIMAVTGGVRVSFLVTSDHTAQQVRDVIEDDQGFVYAKVMTP